MVASAALKGAIIGGEEAVVETEVNKALAGGADADDVMADGLIKAFSGRLCQECL